MRVDQTRNELTLTGEVRHHFQQKAAEHVVGRVPGVLGVTDHIMLTEEPVPSDVAYRVNRAFERSAKIDGSRIKVSNEGHTIYLDGFTNSRTAMDAASDAAWSAAASSSPCANGTDAGNPSPDKVPRTKKGNIIVSLSDQLNDVAVRTKQIEERIAAAQQKAKSDLEAEVKDARDAAQARADALRNRAHESKGKISAWWDTVQKSWHDHLVAVREGADK
jgi:BON domain